MQAICKLKRLFLILLALLVHARHVIAAPDFEVLEKSVVRIVVQAKHGTLTGSGFVINDHGHIATNAHVIDGAEVIKVVPSYSNSLYDVDVIVRSDELDLVILRMQGISLPSIEVSGAQLKKGQRVWSLGYPGRADRDSGPARDATVQEGVVSRMFTGAWKTQPLGIIQHSAETNPGNSGGPLVDDCGRVVGVNTQAPLFLSVSPSGEAHRVTLAAGIYWSSRIEELAKLLDEHHITYRSVNDPCTPAGEAVGSEEAQKARLQAEDARRQAEEARRQAEQANRKTERTRQEADEAKRRAEEATLEARRTRQEADEAKRRAEEATLEARRTRQEVEEATRQAVEATRQAEETSRAIEEARLHAEASRRRFVIGGVVLGGLAFVALLLALKKPRQQIIHVAERMSKPIRRRERERAVRSRAKKNPLESGLVLAGFGGGGNRVRVALSPERFDGQRLGITLGRHPDLVDEVIHDGNVSRRHVRISASDDGYRIEDLNSRNGTFLNRRRLPPFRPERLDYGGTVALGGLEVMVSRY